jgi:hypothetical protein
MKIDGMELPIGYVKITGTAVDALENRKETGSPIDLEDTIKNPPPEFFKGFSGFIQRLNEYVFRPTKT